MKDHEVLHTGGNVYTCTFCDKGFHCPRNRLRLIKTHTGEDLTSVVIVPGEERNMVEKSRSRKTYGILNFLVVEITGRIVVR